MIKDNLTKEEIKGVVHYMSQCPLCENKLPNHLAGQLKFSDSSYDKVWKYACEQQNIRKIIEQKSIENTKLEIAKENSDNRYTKLFGRFYIRR